MALVALVAPVEPVVLVVLVVPVVLVMLVVLGERVVLAAPEPLVRVELKKMVELAGLALTEFEDYCQGT